jgi:alpha-tubulin suppressor-like RCC1 family protein
MNPGPPASLSILSGNNQYFPSNSLVTLAPQQAIIRDALANPVPNVPVTFTATGGNVNGQASVVVNTDQSGVAAVSSSTASAPATVTTNVTSGSLTPVTFTANGFTQGPWHTSCAATTTNAIYCWGDNSLGNVGDGSGQFQTQPAPVAGGQSFPVFAQGSGTHQCGLTAAGAAFCWGNNRTGQVGDNSTTNRLAPVAVQGGHAFTAIATSSYGTCALTTTQMYCWGWMGRVGALGDGDGGTIRTVPTLVNTGGRVFTKLAALDDYTCGLEASGVLSCWGYTPYGQFTTATPVPGAPALTSISSGFYHACGLTAAGAAYCMGISNGFGQIGNGTTSATSIVAVGTGLTFAEIRAYAYNTCARTTANAAYCWGDNGSGVAGKVGDGTSTTRLSPTLVLGGIQFSKLLGGGIVQSCAQAASGQPFCWGNSGYLGDTITTNNLVPSPARWVQGVAGVATSILIETGNNGTGAAGTPVGARPTVIVRDFANNPVANATVTFTVTGGGGALTGGTVQTNAFGQAIVGSWTLGATPGVNTMTATIVGVGTVIFTATGT